MSAAVTVEETSVVDQSQVDAIVSHVVEAVAASDGSDDPFSHFYMQNVFPEDVYRTILASMPPVDCYQPLNLKQWSRPNGESTRDRLFLTAEAVDGFPDEIAGFWRTLAAALGSQEVKKAVFRRLAADLALRFGVSREEAAEIESFPRMLLLRDTEQYRIKPHPDGLEAVVTMQFYLPADETQRQLGTSLYRQCRSWSPLGKKFEEAKRFPFLPNSGYAFAVSNSRVRKSWHGVELVPNGAGVRNTLLFRFMESESHESISY